MPKVSVIIPVYNKEKYLEKCLSSALNQTLSDIELICVYTPSDDNSLKILEDYRARDKRIQIFKLDEVKGVSFARNLGIEKTNGEYLAFLDADDTLANDFLEKLFTNANGFDVVKGNVYNYNNKTKEYFLSDFYNMNDKIRENVAYFYYGFTSAIYKTSFVKENNIKFPLGVNYFEDPYFSINVILKNPKLFVVDDAVYYYNQTEGGLSKQVNFNTLKDFDYCYYMICERLNSSNCSKDVYMVIFEFLYNFALNFYRNTTLGIEFNEFSFGIIENLIKNLKYEKDLYIEKFREEKSKNLFEMNKMLELMNGLILKKYMAHDDMGSFLKILVSYIKPAYLYKSNIFVPIHLGRSIENENSKDGIITDDDLKWLHNNCIGDDDFEGNISCENRRIGFLTGIYKAYKNYEKLGNPEYFGTFGYRKIMYPDFLNNLKNYDCILPQKYRQEPSIKEVFISAHGNNIYSKTLEVLSKLYPDEVNDFENYMNQNEGYLLETYIMKKDLFFEFCKWIFPVMSELLKYSDDELLPDDKNKIIDYFENSNFKNTCNYKNYELYQMRIRAFAIERITGYYLYKLTKKDIKYLEQPIINADVYSLHTRAKLLRTGIKEQYV